MQEQLYEWRKNKYCPKNEFCKVDMKMDKPLDAVISTGSTRNKAR